MRFRQVLTFVGAAASLLLPAGMAHAEEPLPAPTAAAPVHADLPPPSARTNLIITGAATTVVSYGLALGASYLYKEPDFSGSEKLRIPIAGPWLTLAKTGCPTSDPSCSKPLLVVGALLTIFDGVAQAGGLGIIGEGLFLNTSSRPAPRKAEGPTVRAVPFNFERGGMGLGFVGTF